MDILKMCCPGSYIFNLIQFVGEWYSFACKHRLSQLQMLFLLAEKICTVSQQYVLWFFFFLIICRNDCSFNYSTTTQNDSCFCWFCLAFSAGCTQPLTQWKLAKAPALKPDLGRRLRKGMNEFIYIAPALKKNSETVNMQGDKRNCENACQF